MAQSEQSVTQRMIVATSKTELGSLGLPANGALKMWAAVWGGWSRGRVWRNGPPFSTPNTPLPCYRAFMLSHSAWPTVTG